jgi:hypothetical protein
MIVFDLRCSHGHVFEAWFGSSSDFADQQARGLLECPVCGDTGIEKALMAPNIPAKSNRKADALPVASADGPSPEEAKALLKAMADMQKTVEENFDYVGERFADEARAIHYGEREAGGIWGEASAEDVRALHEEGISAAPLPFQRKRRGKRLDA